MSDSPGGTSALLLDQVGRAEADAVRPVTPDNNVRLMSEWDLWLLGKNLRCVRCYVSLAMEAPDPERAQKALRSADRILAECSVILDDYQVTPGAGAKGGLG